MDLNLKWLQPGESVDDFAFCFGFDDTKALFADPSHALDVDWLKGGDTVKSTHNLVILGVGATRCSPDFTRWDKGELEDGTRRYVYPILNHPSLPFRAGLTIHVTKGTWSSLPHEFEREEILLPRPMPFYEKVAYVTEEPGGWGIQTRIGHLYGGPRVEPLRQDYYYDFGDRDSHWVNDTVTIRDRDILDIPLGSHPVCFGPGLRGGYFWIFDSHNAGCPSVTTLITGKREKFQGDKAL
jgi:hypothetical protein